MKLTSDKTERKPNILIRLLAFILTLSLILGAVAAVAWRDRLSLDALRRWYTYRALAKSDSGKAEPFHYEGSLDSLFCDLDGDLLVSSPSAVRIYSHSGVTYLEDTVPAEHPVLTSGGGMAVVYDLGSGELRVYNKRSTVFSIPPDEGRPILSANLSPGGQMAVTTRENGYKGAVTVYDASFKALLSLRLSSSFLMDGIVTEDGKSLAALTAGQGETFESHLLFYHLGDGEEPYADNSLGNSVVLALNCDKEGVWALGEGALWLFSQEGAERGRYDYEGRFLKNAALGGEGFAALTLGKYRAGSAAELVTVGADGNPLGTLPLTEQVLSLSASGRYLAVLTADRLDIYTKDLTLYNTLESTQGARHTVMRGDGSAFLIGSETARLYIPG